MLGGETATLAVRMSTIDAPAPVTKEGTVPLSEHEQRLLDQIEQALYAEDPKFASTVRSARRRRRFRPGLIGCGLGVVAGLGLVLVGLITTIIALSVVGFVLLVASCGYAAQLIRGRGDAVGTGPQRASGKPARPANLRTRMEGRLRRRFDQP
jgi:hypothetical protein